MIVCLCEGVSSRQIATAVNDGAQTVEDVSAKCRAGLGCGACHEQIAELIKALKTLEQASPCDIDAARSH